MTIDCVVTDRDFIKEMGEEKEEENDNFRYFLQSFEASFLDETVHRINNDITPKIDCTTCGACCGKLMINVTEDESKSAATFLHLTETDFKKKYIEESLQGKMIINTIPCHFLEEKKCSIYEGRFAECRDFPHLHKSNFKGRLFGTLIHYAMCPIVFNVIEVLKTELHFKETGL